MNLAEVYERAINWPNHKAMTVALAIAGCLVIVGFVLSFRKPRWFGRILGLFGLVIVTALLFVILEQTTIENASAAITVKRFQYAERTRLLAFVTIIVLPTTAAAVMWLGYLKARYQLRRQVPRHLRAGRKHFAQRDLDSALREYTDAIRAAPELGEAYCRRSVVYHQMGKTAEALTDLNRAIECDPRLPSAYLERGKIRTEGGDFDGALADFGQLMLIRANDPDTYLQRGVCLVKKGLVDDAIADFYRVLKLTNHSDFAEPAKAYLRQALDDRAGAMARYQPNGTSVAPLPPPTRAQDHVL
jgi:tetratricopeptide (TPR) repeat protein